MEYRDLVERLKYLARTFIRDERGLTTLEYVMAAGIIIVVLAAAILAWNNGLAQKIAQTIGKLMGM